MFESFIKGLFCFGSEILTRFSARGNKEAFAFEFIIVFKVMFLDSGTIRERGQNRERSRSLNCGLRIVDWQSSSSLIRNPQSTIGMPRRSPLRVLTIDSPPSLAYFPAASVVFRA